MPTLSSSIVKHQVATMQEVEEALARQVLYGGDLATNLLELAAVGEAELTGLLAESHGLEPAPVGELPRAEESTLQLVPGDLALRHGFYPLTERDGELAIAVSEPLAAEVEQDLSFALGATIVQRGAPLVRIRQAIARDYALPLDRRTLRLIAKLEGRPDPSPSSMPGPRRGYSEIQGLPRPPSIPPLQHGLSTEPIADSNEVPTQRIDSRPPPAQVEQAPKSEPETQRLPAAPDSPQPESMPEAPAPESQGAAPDLAGWVRAASRAGRPKTRHRGPYTAAMAEQDLLYAESRDDVLRSLFDFAAQYFEYAALFAVHSDIAEGRDARGPGADRTRITGIGVPLDLPGALATARNKGSWQLIPLASEGIDGTLAEDLERRTGKVVLLLPIVVRGRCVLILYGDLGNADVQFADIGEVIAFAPLVAPALERVIVKNKLAARNALAQETEGALSSRRLAALGSRLPHARPTRPSREERARVLAEALVPNLSAPVTKRATPAARAGARGAPAPSTSAAPAAPRTATAHGSQAVHTTRVVEVGGESRHSTPRGPELVRPVISVGAEPRVSTPPHGTPKVIESVPPPGATPVFELTRRSTPAAPLEDEPPEDGWEAVPAPSAFPTEEAGTKPGVGTNSDRASRHSTPVPLSQRGSNPHLELVTEEADREAPDLAIGETRLDKDLDNLERESEVPLAPPSRSLAHAPHRLRPRFSSKELKLPTVIVDVESDCQELVMRLVKGDQEAGDQLVEIGEPAVSALVSKFPGPITAEPRRGETPTLASECGPILQTLARLGHVAVPFLVVRTADSSPDVRAWATRLLGELPGVESATAVVRRLVDPAPEVHHAALAAARMLLSDADSRTAVREGLVEIAFDRAQPEVQRHGAIEALADLRDARAIPRLIRMLDDANADIVKSAEWALGVIARQAFGRDPTKWSAWWKEHGSAHRVEWLIESLMHEDSDVRRAAGEELKSLTKEYFGYYEDLPRKERARAQKRYREWWDSKGKARFS